MFFTGNSRLNCQIIESIFNMSLVYLSLHMLVHRSMSFIVVHVTKICCFDFVISNFHLNFHRKFATSHFAISNFRERSCIFRFELHKTSFENSTTFHRKFARTKDEFRRTSFALLLHSTVVCVGTGWTLHVRCVQGKCNYTRVKFTDLVVTHT